MTMRPDPARKIMDDEPDFTEWLAQNDKMSKLHAQEQEDHLNYLVSHDEPLTIEEEEEVPRDLFGDTWRN